MNDKLLRYLSNDVSLYPSRLEAGFPRVFDKLLEHCGSSQFNQCLTELLFDVRGRRRGFPEEVVNELWKLQRHQLQIDSANADQSKQDYWNWTNF